MPNGNVVLYDKNDRLVWQSFDHPVDALLVGQTLKNKLVSKNGAYSLVLEPTGLSMYINNASSSRTPLKYGAFVESQKLSSVKFECEPEDEGKFAYELRLALGVNIGTEILARPKYNATLSFLRLEEDGNLVVYTYYDPVDYRAWEKTFAFFSDDLGRVDGCDLPTKCGALGVCEDEMCVACPTRRGLLGWSENCATQAIAGKCKRGRSLEYYKVEGVDNFLSGYGEGEGRLKVEECRRRCDLDCECVGFLYWEKESKCWVAPWIGTLKSVADASHVAYIKYAN
ncbi:epidermis-specific secreted glycoprotein EP1-like [Asparagus officinalis]|uniref:epidermis-specific secreted glycoprotein EP1-like n=1 Tax=Asparagus officinalis TaxID=4686 RepID=UPI00098E5198|nr:epidermis-specific secreted glycoprotein EP1-like [Asparagus officinalis]